MHGMQVPLILVPRFTSYMGARDFISAPIDASRYHAGSLTIWRGALQGTSPEFKLYVQFSSDAHEDNWIDFPLVSPLQHWADPGANTAQTYGFGAINRWMRCKVTLSGTFPEVTCWAAGLLAERTDG